MTMTARSLRPGFANADPVAGSISRETAPPAWPTSATEPCPAELFRKLGPKMAVTARRFLPCEADCADAVQDAFLAAVRSLDRFQGRSAFDTWLHRILVNACLLKLRSRARERTMLRKDLSLQDGDAAPVAGHEPSLVRLSRLETQRLVRAGIERLPGRYREVVWLRDIEELDTEETARQLGIAPGAVKTRLHRARIALRKLLLPLSPEGDLGLA
jgi:RNA polymerase sigma-70 factor (ECF subfamily)